MKTITALLIAACGASTLAAAPDNKPWPGTASAAAPCPAGHCAACTPATDTPLALSDQARDGLLFQIEEERMARELYAAFADRWRLRPFQNIQRSEARHEAALRLLASRGSLALSPADPGVFAVAEIQRRRDDLLALGLQSAEAALRAGALVEETDIADLRSLAPLADDSGLRTTLAALERASHNHLRAFVRTLRARGVVYQPTVLSVTEFDSIVSAGQACGRRP